MEQEVKEFVEQMRSEITTFDKGHGRLEERIYTLDTNIGWFADKQEWKNLAAFGMCESIITRKGKKTIEKRYFIRAETCYKKSIG